MAKSKWMQRERVILEGIFRLKRRILSGAGWLLKEDAAGPTTLAQMKSTEGAGITMQRDDLKILRRHAQQERKHPFFVVDFLPNATDPHGELWVAAPYRELLQVAQELHQLQKGECQNTVSSDPVVQTLSLEDLLS